MSRARPAARPAAGRLVALGILAALAAGVPPRPAPAGERFPQRSVQRPRFVVNLVPLPATADSVRVDVVWEVPWSELVFRREDDWFRARYDVSVVFSRDGRQVGGEVWERRVRARRLSETVAADSESTGRRSVVVGPGEYEVRVAVTDRNSRARASVEGRLDAFSGGERIGLSDPRVVRYTGDTAVAVPGNEVPVGEEGYAARVIVHPAADVTGEARVSWSLVDPEGRSVASDDTTVTLAGRPVTAELAIPGDRISAGEHRLEVRVTGPDGKPGANRTAILHGRLTPEWFRVHRPEAMEVFRMLATDDELRILDGATDAAWPQRVAEFWQRRDPSPGSPRNEFRDRIQARMETAATLFREPFLKPGWRTDRGRILLQFGEPQRRAIQGGGFDGPASELWEYDAPIRRFLFVDERGTGEYWLRG